MKRCSIRTLALAVTVASIASSAFAIAPTGQTITHDPVVRILRNLDANSQNGLFWGTGTIIGNLNRGGMGYYCVITADHVVSSAGTAGAAPHTGLGIGFGNKGPGGIAAAGGDGLKASYIARQPAAGVDIALLGIKYGMYDQTKDALVRSVVVPNITTAPGSGVEEYSNPVTIMGYGNEGVLNGAGTGYNSTGNYGTLRYANNKVTSVRRGYNPFDGYTFDAFECTNDEPGSAGSIPGEGITFDGDSGSAYFSTGGEMVGNNLVKKNGIVAIHSYGKNSPALWGSKFGGVIITQDIKNWIDTKCAAVPEPATMTALALGVAALARRRRQS